MHDENEAYTRGEISRRSLNFRGHGNERRPWRLKHGYCISPTAHAQDQAVQAAGSDQEDDHPGAPDHDAWRRQEDLVCRE